MPVKKPSANDLLEEYVSPAGAKLYMTPDSRVFASREAATAHVVEHAHEIEADEFIEYVLENAPHFFPPSVGERGMQVQLSRMKSVIVSYLTWKADGPLPPLKSEKPGRGRPRKTADDNPLT